MDIKNEICLQITNFFKTKDIIVENLYLEVPKAKNLGDFSTTVALKYAKQAGVAPQVLANELVEFLNTFEYIESCSVAGPGFLNIFVSSNTTLDFINSIVNATEIKFSTYEGKSANIEYVSANPTGNLHLGHGRNAAYGSALTNILRKVGYKVETEYWINDFGNQMDKLALSIFGRYKELFGLDFEIPEGGYVSSDVIEVAQAIKDKYEDKYLDYDYKKLINELRIIGCDIYLDRIRKILKDFNVEIDQYTSESEFYGKGDVDAIIADLEKVGLIYELDGAKWFKSTNYGDDKDRVVIKTDGNYTYMCGDMALHKDKFSRNHDLYVNVWGADHHGYIPRLKGLIDAMGYDSNKLVVPLIQLVQLINDNGEIEKMSKRKGNAITVDELIEMIGVDAARYFFIMKPNNTHLNFDLKLAKESSSSNPVFYIQYAQTRINSVLNRANVESFADATLDNLSKEDLDIVSFLMKYENVLNTAAKELAPHKLCNYLYELATKFHKLYANSQFISEDELKTKDYLKLITAIRMVILDGLNILGLSTPEVM